MKPTAIRFRCSSLVTAAILLLAWSGANGQTITFDTRPYDPAVATGASGVSGEAYSYDADATASNGATIKYVLRYGPAGMTVNASTGVTTWTPPRAGTYLAEIRAELVNNPSVHELQGWAILVTECDGNAFISGSVTNQDGDPLNSGTVTAQVVGPTRTPLTKVTVPIVNGAYEMTVDHATYTLRVEGSGIITEWYTDAYDFTGATHVTPACQSTTTADFEVVTPATYPPGDVILSGYIVRENDDLPLLYSRIRFYSIPRWQWESTEERWRLKLRLKTSDNYGRYDMVNENGAYYADAQSNQVVWFPVAFLGGSDETTYGIYRQFYDYTPNPLAAKPLIANGDTSFFPVNFLINDPDTSSKPIPVDVMGGTPDLQGGFAVVAYAIQQTDNGWKVDPSRSLVAGGWLGGNMHVVAKGKYVLFVIPEDTNYVPGFYRKGDTAALLSGNATIIDTDTVGHDAFYDPDAKHVVILRRKNPASGTSDVRGRVSSGINSTEKGGSIQSLEPLSAAFVYALDSLGNLASFTFANDDGSYILKGLGEGTYDVHADLIGYSSAESQNISLTGTGEIAEASFTLVENVSTSVPGSPTMHQVAVNVQPNPASETVTIGFAGKAGKARLTLIAADGREVLAREMQTINGKNRTALDVSELPNGAYVGSIDGEGYSATVRITVAR